jgi:hypothetical protein
MKLVLSRILWQNMCARKQFPKVADVCAIFCCVHLSFLCIAGELAQHVVLL